MPVRLLNNGNNKIQIAQDFLDTSDGTITINGDGSHVLIGDGANAFERMSLTCGPSSTVHIGHGVRLASVQIYVCPHSKLLIGITAPSPTRARSSSTRRSRSRSGTIA